MLDFQGKIADTIILSAWDPKRVFRATTCNPIRRCVTGSRRFPQQRAIRHSCTHEIGIPNRKVDASAWILTRTTGGCKGRHWSHLVWFECQGCGDGNLYRGFVRHDSASNTVEWSTANACEVAIWRNIIIGCDVDAAVRGRELGRISTSRCVSQVEGELAESVGVFKLEAEVWVGAWNVRSWIVGWEVGSTTSCAGTGIRVLEGEGNGDIGWGCTASRNSGWSWTLDVHDRDLP